MNRAPMASKVLSPGDGRLPVRDNGEKSRSTISVLLETLSALGYEVGSELPDQQLAYSEQDAAKLLSISPRTLFTLRKEGKVRAVKVGNRVIYSREELKRFLAGSAE